MPTRTRGLAAIVTPERLLAANAVLVVLVLIMWARRERAAA